MRVPQFLEATNAIVNVQENGHRYIDITGTKVKFLHGDRINSRLCKKQRNRQTSSTRLLSLRIQNYLKADLVTWPVSLPEQAIDLSSKFLQTDH
jgi:hypothetical protein